MKAVGVVVADGTAAGGFSVKGLTEELEAAELDVAVPLEPVGAEEEEETLPADESELLDTEAELIIDAEDEAEEDDVAFCAATAATAGSSATSVLKAGIRMMGRGMLRGGQGGEIRCQTSGIYVIHSLGTTRHTIPFRKC